MTAERLTILHLYPRQMGVSGDRGNVTAIVTRAAAADLATEVVRYDVGDPIPRDVDVVVLGNGPLSAMRSLGDDPGRLAPFLQDAVAAGVPLVAVGGGYDLATREVVPTEGAPVPGLGVFDARAVRGAERRVNYFLLDVRMPLPGGDQRVAGFEDHATRIENADPGAVFADVVSGGGNQDGTGTEGSVTGSAFGTHTQGPLLPLNPHLTDAVLAAATGRLGRDYRVDPARTAAVDRYARESRGVITRFVDKAFKRIA